MKRSDWLAAGLFGMAFVLVLCGGCMSRRSQEVPKTPTEAPSEGDRVPTQPIARIEEQIQKYDEKGNVIESTTRIIIYVEAEG